MIDFMASYKPEVAVNHLFFSDSFFLEKIFVNNPASRSSFGLLRSNNPFTEYTKFNPMADDWYFSLFQNNPNWK